MSQMIESFMNDARQPPVRASAIALEELAAVDAPGAPLALPANPLHAVKVRLQVLVGGAGMTVKELLAVRENAVLQLDRTIDQPVDLLLEGKVVARGQLVAVGDAFGVRITELPVPLTC